MAKNTRTLAYVQFLLYLCSKFNDSMAKNEVNRALAAKKYIVMAEEGEFSLLDKAREQLGFDMSDATVLYTGVGAINVIRKLMDLDREAEIYNIGYAGSANFDLGTWVEVTEARLNHPNVTYPEPELKISHLTSHISNCLQAPCYTNCDFVLASDYKDCVFDMELAFIAALGFKNLHGAGFHRCARFQEPA